MIKAKYKLMAYILSSGLWDGFGHTTLENVLGFKDEDLEACLTCWHSTYDDQFRKTPYDFDWERFNDRGAEIAMKINSMLPPGVDIYYEPSDDREFFSREECVQDPGGHPHVDSQYREFALRTLKRSLLYCG